MVLLHSLVRLSKKLDISIHVAHLDHGIRKTSERDALFVKDTCKRLGVPVVVERRVVERKKGETLEEAARRVRYVFLREAKEMVGADVIATAHHKNDLAETLIHRIVRGTGLRGLVGMRPRDGDIARPLMVFTREEIEKFAEEESINFVVDETNYDTSYTRNFIRHRVVPLLKEINPSVEESLYRLSRTASLFQDFLDLEVEKLLRRSRKLVLGVEVPASSHPFVLLEALRRVVEEMEGELPRWEETMRVLDLLEEGGKVRLWRNFGFWVSMERVFVGELGREEREYELEEGEYDFWDFRVKVRRGYGLKRAGRMVLRNRRKGDKIGGKKLKDLMVEWKLPAYLRDEVPLVEVGGKIVWIGGRLIERELEGEGFEIQVIFSGGDRV